MRERRFGRTEPGIRPAVSATLLPTAAGPATAERPRLVYFYASTSGRCRKTEGFLAQVLQRRRNHETFDLVRVAIDLRPELAQRFRIEVVPTFLVVEGRRIRRRIVDPGGSRDLERGLAPWLR